MFLLTILHKEKYLYKPKRHKIGSRKTTSWKFVKKLGDRRGALLEGRGGRAKLRSVVGPENTSHFRVIHLEWGELGILESGRAAILQGMLELELTVNYQRTITLDYDNKIRGQVVSIQRHEENIARTIRGYAV